MLTTSDKAIAKTYGWDGASRIASIADLADAALNATYGYDGLDRLASANKGANAWGYTFDGVGNRLTRTVNGATTTHGYVAGGHRLASLAGAQVKSYAYDATGNWRVSARWPAHPNRAPNAVFRVQTPRASSRSR